MPQEGKHKLFINMMGIPLPTVPIEKLYAKSLKCFCQKLADAKTWRMGLNLSKGMNWMEKNWRTGMDWRICDSVIGMKWRIGMIWSTVITWRMKMSWIIDLGNDLLRNILISFRKNIFVKKFAHSIWALWKRCNHQI